MRMTSFRKSPYFISKSISHLVFCLLPCEGSLYSFSSVCSINLLQSIGFFRLTMARSSDLGFRTSPSHYFLQVKLKLQEVPHLPLHQEAPDLSPAAVIQDKFQGLSSNKFSTYLVRSLITSYFIFLNQFLINLWLGSMSGAESVKQLGV